MRTEMKNTLSLRGAFFATKQSVQRRLRDYCAEFTVIIVLLIFTVACQAANGASNTTDVWSGFLEGKTIDLSPEVGGRITSVAVKEGEVVQPGQPLVLIDDELIRWRIDAADANVAAAEAQLKILELGARAEDLKKAQARVEQAQAAFLAASQAVTDTESIRANPQALIIAKTDAEARAFAASQQLIAAVKHAEAADEEVRFWEEQTRNLEEGMTLILPGGRVMHFDTPTARLVYARDEWNKASNRAWQAWAAVESANANARIANDNFQDISDQLTNPIALDNRVYQARAARDRAAANLQAAQAGWQILRDGASQSQIQIARAAVDQAKAVRAMLDQELTRHTLTAPRAGIVTRVAYRAGEIVAPGQAIVRLSIAGDLKLRVFVAFSQTEKIRVGDVATIFVTELNNRKLTGTIANIGDRAEFSGRQAQTDSERNAQLVAVEIAVQETDPQVKAGMPASVIFGTVPAGLELKLPELFKSKTQKFSGSLETKQTRVASEMSARAVAVRVQRGDGVKRGDVLVELDDAAIKTALNEADAAVRAAQSNLDQVNEKVRPGTLALAQAGVAQANADLTAARAALDSANRTLKTPQELLTQLHIAEGKVVAAQGEIGRAEATLAGIKSQIEIAEQDLSRSGKMRLAILQKQKEGAEATLRAAQNSLTASLRTYELHKQLLAQPLELLAAQHNAEHQTKIAEAGLKIAQAELELTQRGAQKEHIDLAEAKLRAAQASQKIVQAQAKRFSIVAPSDGQVIGKSIEPGETVRVGVPLVTLADTRELEMLVYVPIGNIGALKVGQTGKLTLPSLPGKSFDAKIVYIAPEAEFKPANIYNSKERSEMVFAVRVSIANPNGELKAGLPADVTF